MDAERILVKRATKNVLLGLLSGPVWAGLILLIPLGVLTGLNVALDPSLAIDEFAPEEELFIPFLLLALLFSAANGRLAWVMSRERVAEQLFKVTTERFLSDPSSSFHAHGHRGRQLALDLKKYLADEVDGSVIYGEVAEEDYGWRFDARRKDFSEVRILIAHVGQPDGETRVDEYVLTVVFEPPFLPWRRLTYEPDFDLYREMKRHITQFLRVNDLSFVVEREQWVDPEPGMNTGPMF